MMMKMFTNNALFVVVVLTVVSLALETVDVNVSGVHAHYAAAVTAAQGQGQEPGTGVADRTRVRARDFGKRQLKKSKNKSKSKSSKSSKNSKNLTRRPKSRSFTGSYAGLDSEDGTQQTLYMYCENGLCDVKLEDLVFSTCIEVTGNAYFGGIAIANGVPEDSLDDFDLALYCLEEGQLEIDLNTDTPITTLKGNMIGLEDGVIRRTGTGFTYFSNYRGNLSVDKPSVPKNGVYAGTDTQDGTNQNVQIYCKDGICDVTLGDLGFSTCTIITGNPFFGGIAIARNVPEESLDDFTLDLYCLGVGEFQFSNTPTGTLTGSMIVLKDGIIRRTGPGFTFYLVSDKNGSTEGQIGNGKYWNTGSTTDGSRSAYEILCVEGKCDVGLEDFIFPACFALTGTYYLVGGFAIAKGIDQASLGDFSLDIYCAKGLGIDIDMDNDQPVATIAKGFEVLEDGILLDIDSGNQYFNWYSGGNPANPTTSLYPNGFYYGTILDNGLLGMRTIYCNENKLCDIVSSSVSFNPCIHILQDVSPRPFNGVAIVKDVPQDSLDDFAIDLYCLAPAQQVDYGVTIPALAMRGGMVARGNGVVTAPDPANTTYFIS